MEIGMGRGGKGSCERVGWSEAGVGDGCRMDAHRGLRGLWVVG